MVYLFPISNSLPRPGPRAGSKLDRVGYRLLLAIGLVCGGCDSESFVPARPAELGGSNAGSTIGSNPTAPTTSPSSASGVIHSGARAIELIVGSRDAKDSESLKLTARAVAGRERARILIAVTGEIDSPGTEAELVRKAITRNPSALIVEAADPADSDLAKALNEARDRGLPVVVMGRPLTGLPPVPARVQGSGKAGGRAVGPLVNLVPEPFARSARPMVEDAVRNARNAKLSPEGAVIMINTSGDGLFEDRALALREALRNAGITAIEELRFAGNLDKGQADLIALLRANRKLTLVLATDLLGMTAGLQATGTLGDGHLLVIAGYASDDTLAHAVKGGDYAAMAIFSAERLIAKAVTTAAAVARGERLPDRVELLVPVLDSPEDSATPKMYRAYRSMNREQAPAETKQEDHR